MSAMQRQTNNYTGWRVKSGTCTLYVDRAIGQFRDNGRSCWRLFNMQWSDCRIYVKHARFNFYVHLLL